MAVKHAKDARVWFNQHDLSAYLHTASLAAAQDTADATTFASGGWKESEPGQVGVSVAMAGYHDPDFTALEDYLGSSGGILTACAGGASAVGDQARLAQVLTSTLTPANTPVGGLIAIAWDVTADAALGIGEVLHPKGEDTNTTTGDSKNDGAATTTGWMSHLHVFAVDGGSWVIKLQDSADNSSWSDVTGGAFTAATGATSQRLTSATGATLRRYVRYVATRTGGSAGDGITFALAYARNV